MNMHYNYVTRFSSLRILLLISLLLCTALWADINVKFQGESRARNLRTTQLNGVEYTGFNDLNPLFKSMIKTEFSDHRVFFYIYGEQFIFLLDSPYYTFNNAQFNMHYPIQSRSEGIMVPAVFVREHLPERLPAQLSKSGNTLNAAVPVDKSVTTIVLDPGHGGRDPGAVGRALRTNEKDVVLQVALQLKSMLERELGVRVLMTRSDDRFMSLGDRTRFANDNKADLFVSIHANASNNRSANGIETYYLSVAGTTDSRAVEALENNVVELYEGAEARAQYDALAFILSDLSQTEHLENSNVLASLVQQNLVAGTRWYNRGVKQANFFVLRGAFMPAILAEVGFISNPDEEARLINPEYQNRLARSLFEGIKRFKFRYDRIRNT